MSDDHAERAFQRAIDAFKKHELIASCEWELPLAFGRRRCATWLICPPGGDLSCSVIAGTHGMLLVQGDVETAAFQYGPEDPIRRLEWIGRKDMFCAASKYCIGTGRNSHEFNENKARRDILRLRRARELNRAAARAGYDAAATEYDGEVLGEKVFEAMFAEDEAMREIHRLGEAPTQGFLQALAAVRRCWQLVSQKDGL